MFINKEDILTKEKWGPDMTELTLSGVEDQELKGWT